MSRSTSVDNIADVLQNKQVNIIKTEYQYNDPSLRFETTSLDKDTALQSIISLADNPVFRDCCDWRYSDITATGYFVIYGDMHDSVGTIVVIHVRVDESVIDAVRKKLRETIFSRNRRDIL